MARATIRVDRMEDSSADWRRVVDTLPGAGLAHSPEWFTAIERAYGHEPLYLIAEDTTGVGVLPAFVVRRPLLGTVVSSMPFLDSGGPCSSTGTLSQELIERLLDEARRRGARFVEIRCKDRLPIASHPAEDKVTLTRALPDDPDRLWKQLDGSLRNQVRKAQRSGLSVEVGGIEQLGDFYDIFVVRMRELGSPVHGHAFLRSVVEAFETRARIVLVRKGPTVVGGLVTLAFKNTLVVPWASCLSEYFSLCPNMLLYWETLRDACARGIQRFDFGRSTRDSGTYRFKRQWGATEQPLFWYTIGLAGRSRPASDDRQADRAILERVWQGLPLSFTRHLGPPIRRYLTQ